MGSQIFVRWFWAGGIWIFPSSYCIGVIFINSTLIGIPKRIPMPFRLYFSTADKLRLHETKCSGYLQKKKILWKSVHPVHLWFLFLRIIILSGDHLDWYSSPLFTRGEHYSPSDVKVWWQCLDFRPLRKMASFTAWLKGTIHLRCKSALSEKRTLK